ncbi:MAG: SdpI family protein [Ignavibacterium sp.]
MEIIQNPGFIILLLCGIIFLIAGLIQSKYPPKKINSLYGYRTISSMRSKEAWDFAQKYSAKISIWAGLLMMFFAVTSLQFPNISKEYQVWFSLIIIFSLVGILIFLTEQKLKNFR